MSKIEVLVFPDYSSTGLWIEDGATSISLTELGINDDLLDVALRNWHDVWEYTLADSTRLSAYFIKHWLMDGQKIVNYLNTTYAQIATFTYKTDASEFKSIIKGDINDVSIS